MRVFISYTRLKDEFNAVSSFRQYLENELRQILPSSSVFHDTAGIEPGEHFRQRLSSELDASDILIVLLSPSWLASNWCRWEFEYFGEVIARRGCGDVVPVLWVATPALNVSAQDLIARRLAAIEYDDWRQLRHELPESTPQIRRRVAQLAEAIAKLAEAQQSLQQPPNTEPATQRDSATANAAGEPSRNTSNDVAKRPFLNILKIVARSLDGLRTADVTSLYEQGDRGKWPTASIVTPAELRVIVQRAQTFDADLYCDLVRLDEELLYRVRLKLNEMTFMANRRWRTGEGDLKPLERELGQLLQAASSHTSKTLERLEALP